MISSLEAVHDLPKFKEGTVAVSNKTGPVWVHRVYLGTGSQVKEDINLVEKETLSLTSLAPLYDFNLTKTNGSWGGVWERGLVLEVITSGRHDKDYELGDFIRAYKHKFKQNAVYVTHHRVDSEVF